MKLTYATLCCLLIFATACNKRKNDSPTGRMLMSGKWQIIASTYTTTYMGRDTVIDFYSNWRACEQDDFMVLKAKGKGTSNENTNKCAEDDQESEFTWELQNNDTRLQLTLAKGKFVANGGNTITSDILEISDNTLKLQSLDSNGSRPPTIETYTKY